jgi:hypothetical protein
MASDLRMAEKVVAKKCRPIGYKPEVLGDISFELQVRGNNHVSS